MRGHHPSALTTAMSYRTSDSFGGPGSNGRRVGVTEHLERPPARHALEPHLQPEAIVLAIHPGLRPLQAPAHDADLEPRRVTVGGVLLATDVVGPAQPAAVLEPFLIPVEDQSLVVQVRLDFAVDGLEQLVAVPPERRVF